MLLMLIFITPTHTRARIDHSTTSDRIAHAARTNDLILLHAFCCQIASIGAMNSKNMNLSLSKSHMNERQFQCASVMEYLQNDILSNIIVQTKNEFFSAVIDANRSNRDQKINNVMNTGFTTLYSHQCPIIRPNYQCANLKNDRFENYTINMGLNISSLKLFNKKFARKIIPDTSFGKKNDIDMDNFHMNLESKFLKRLFDNGAFLNSKKNLTIVFWGNSYLRQAFEAIECLLFQFDFTPLKFFKYTDSKHFDQYTKTNYVNKHGYKAEIKVDTNLHRMDDMLENPFLKPCESSKSNMLDRFVSQFGVTNIEEYILQYTNWTDIYAQYYLSYPSQKTNNIEISKLFSNLNKTDIRNKLLSIDHDYDKNNNYNNDDDKVQLTRSVGLSDIDRETIAKNMGEFSYNCGDDESFIQFFNNKTRTTNTLINIISNFDKVKHTMMQGFETFVSKCNKYDNVNHFINDIDVMFINFGNKYDIVDRYSLKMFSYEYQYFTSIRKKYANDNINTNININIPLIVVSPWDYNIIDKKQWQIFENTFIKTNKLPIVYYNLTNTIVGISQNETRRLHSEGSHWCMPGPSIKYAFTFLQIVEIIVQHCTDINSGHSH